MSSKRKVNQLNKLDEQVCCSSSDIRLASFNLDGNKDICNNCENTSDRYSPELGQAIFGNPQQEYDFDKMDKDSHVSEQLLRSLAYFSAGNSSYAGEYENDVFSIRSYYWGDEEELSQLPNFHYKPSNFKISWYKYIGRGMSCNKAVCPKCFLNIFNHCINSLENKK